MEADNVLDKETSIHDSPFSPIFQTARVSKNISVKG